MRERWELSERRACRVVAANRSSIRREPRGHDDEPLRQRLRELAEERRRFGYRRLHVFLRREGGTVNHKRAYRLSRGDGLAGRRRGRKRGAPAATRPPPPPICPDGL